MRKLILALTVFVLLIFGCGCAAVAEDETEKSIPTVDSSDQDSKILVAYFSRPGENYNVGTVNEGNTAKLAKEIALQTGGFLFEIVPETAYPVSYDEMLEVATQERSGDDRPVIRDTKENFDEYEIVFIGYPIWWGDLPMIMHSFMESYDFDGKTVIPFNTHEGSGQADTQNTIEGKLIGAKVLQGFAMRGSEAQELACDGTDAAVKKWLEGLEFNVQSIKDSGLNDEG